LKETHIVLANMDTVGIDSKGNIDSVVDDQRYPMSAGDFEEPSASLDEVGGGECLLAQLDDGDAAEDELLDMVFERRCRRRQQIGIGDEIQRVVDFLSQYHPHGPRALDPELLLVSGCVVDVEPRSSGGIDGGENFVSVCSSQTTTATHTSNRIAERQRQQ
jgi:hypothetical protein